MDFFKLKLSFAAYPIVLIFLATACQEPDPSENNWSVGDPVLLPRAAGSWDEVAVKDPSVVYYQNQWHLFYTARSENEYTTGYLTAASWEALGDAPRHQLPVIRGETPYGCAPQIFYFEPLQQWFLLFQNKNANYQPAFSTTSTINDPSSWSEAQDLLPKDTPEKWIDFWIICDQEQAYLFYTQAHQGVMVRSTRLSAFPKGWGAARQVFDNVHEAVHVYKVKDQAEYHLIYEINQEGIRSFGLAKAEQLNGPWTKVTDEYATGTQLKFTGQQAAWTEMVSHGEAIRSGYNQYLEYDPEACRWLIQGIREEELGVPYPSLPWRLGIMKRL